MLGVTPQPALRRGELRAEGRLARAPMGVEESFHPTDG